MKILEQLESKSEEIITLAENLFLTHSSILYFPQPINGIFDMSHKSYRWGDLSDEGKQVQSKLYAEYNKFKEILSYLLQKQIPEIKQKFNKSSDIVL